MAGEYNNCKQLQNGSGTVLVIDDEEIVRKTAATILHTAGYTTILSPGGRSAVKILEENPELIDVVLLDMMMPDMSGKETYSQLKKIKENIKAIISTGYLAEENINELLKLGFIDYIKKPFSAHDLADTVHRAICENM